MAEVKRAQRSARCPRPHSAAAWTQMSEREEWRPVRRWEGFYEVSNLGRVRTVKTGRIHSAPLNRKYPTVYLHIRPRQETVAVHRLVADAFIGPRPEGQEVRHLDGNHANVVASNLIYGTHSENMMDRRLHGTARNMHTDQTHCLRGHAFSPENTYRYVYGDITKRACKACGAIRGKERAARLAAERNKQ